MSESSSEFLDLSDEALDDYRKAKKAGTSVRTLYNRLYYASFYAAKAALLAVGEEPKTHRGTANLLFQVLYQEKDMVKKDTAAFLSTIQRKRDEADYQTEFDDTVEDVEDTEKKAKEFINRMKDIVEEET
ncbi:MAG: HEPN domain-containing protein [Candidatus Nanohaloarchaea archaeon]|nr:HEPN domain-containing protein [Candidatus Nanohaloarchaea archaeon]